MTNLATCTGCGAPIRWVLTVGGKRMPLDPAPVVDGNVVPFEDDGTIRARVLTGAELPAQGPAWQSHYRSCPASDEFRRRRAATTPRCPHCGGVMDRWLVEHGWTAHVTCGAPPDLRARVTSAAGPSGGARPAAEPVGQEDLW